LVVLFGKEPEGIEDPGDLFWLRVVGQPTSVEAISLVSQALIEVV
jgi:hypothetical protein